MHMWAFDYPQTYAVTGSAEEQIAQLRTYIWQLVDALNQMDGVEAGANKTTVDAALDGLPGAGVTLTPMTGAEMQAIWDANCKE